MRSEFIGDSRVTRNHLPSSPQMQDSGGRRRERLDRLQIGCRGLAAAAVGFDIKGELLPLVKAANPGALDGGDVDEHIRAARVLHDEAVALLGVEKLNGTCSHNGLLLKTRRAFAAVRTIRAVQSGFCVFLRKAQWHF